MKKNLLVALFGAFGVLGNAQTFTNYTSSDGLLADNVNAVDTDANNTIWFGTQNGVSEYDGSTWVDHTNAIDAGLIDDNIQALTVMSNGDIWVGTDFGASVYSGGSWTAYTNADGLGNNQIKCIEEAANGDVWFGTNTGASLFDGVNWTNFGIADGIPFGGVTAIMIQANGDVWLGSGLNGIRIYDGSNFSPITSVADGLIDDRIRGMRNDNSDQRWIATSEGISVLNSSNVVVTQHTMIYSLPAPDTLNPIEDVEIDNNGNIWVGVYVDYLVTEGGVVAFDGNSWVEYDVSDGLVGPVIRQLAIDGNNDVWVATSTGVSKISNHSVAIIEAEQLDYSMYPNPANTSVNLKFEKAENQTRVGVFSASMQLIDEIDVASGKTELSISIEHLSRGVYFVSFNGTTKKLIVY